LTPKVFTKLLGLFVLLLVFQTAVMEFVFRGMVVNRAGVTIRLIAHEALWAGLIALALALVVAFWVARNITERVQRVVDFARRIADGDLSARLTLDGQDELSAMEKALNQTA